MAKTGSGSQLGTAEGALSGRALHATHAESPVLDDFWAIELLSPEGRAQVRASSLGLQPSSDFDARPILAVSLGCLRYAEDEVERCTESGIAQYVILGAGFDSFALRREDMADRLTVYEVDHPDVQALKRERIERADRRPAALPRFVPVDFETTRLTDALPATGFDAAQPAVFSWLNTLPYLTKDATLATFEDLRTLAAPGSRLIVNYGADVPLSEEQTAFMAKLRDVVVTTGEPFRSRWQPEEFASALEGAGFRIVEHATEADLTERYFAGRSDGLKPGVPLRVVTAERTKR